jgi:hypothetical protein
MVQDRLRRAENSVAVALGRVSDRCNQAASGVAQILAAFLDVGPALDVQELGLVHRTQPSCSSTTTPATRACTPRALCGIRLETERRGSAEIAASCGVVDAERR